MPGPPGVRVSLAGPPAGLARMLPCHSDAARDATAGPRPPSHTHVTRRDSDLAVTESQSSVTVEITQTGPQARAANAAAAPAQAWSKLLIPTYFSASVPRAAVAAAAPAPAGFELYTSASDAGRLGPSGYCTRGPLSGARRARRAAALSAASGTGGRHGAPYFPGCGAVSSAVACHDQRRA